MAFVRKRNIFLCPPELWTVLVLARGKTREGVLGSWRKALDRRVITTSSCGDRVMSCRGREHRGVRNQKDQEQGGQAKTFDGQGPVR